MTESTLKPLRDKEVEELLAQGWTMVVTGEPNKRRDVEDIDKDFEQYEETSRWCEQQIGGIGHGWTAYGLYTFLFEDPKNAILFKLAWGMTS